MDAPISLDPLIPEAKRRMLRRRLVFGAAAVAVVAAGLTFGLRPSGSSPVQRAKGAGDSSKALAGLSVPIDSTERHWRASVRALGGVPVSDDATARHRLSAVVRDSGATIVRLTIWHGTSPAAVELVVATAVRPAVYLRHRVERFLPLLKRPNYLKVVNARGSMVFEWGGVSNEGFLGVPPRLYYCNPVSTGMPPPYHPCPAK